MFDTGHRRDYGRLAIAHCLRDEIRSPRNNPSHLGGFPYRRDQNSPRTRRKKEKKKKKKKKNSQTGSARAFYWNRQSHSSVRLQKNPTGLPEGLVRDSVYMSRCQDLIETSLDLGLATIATAPEQSSQLQALVKFQEVFVSLSGKEPRFESVPSFWSSNAQLPR